MFQNADSHKKYILHGTLHACPEFEVASVFLFVFQITTCIGHFFKILIGISSMKRTVKTLFEAR